MTISVTSAPAQDEFSHSYGGGRESHEPDAAVPQACETWTHSDRKPKRLFPRASGASVR